MRLPPRLCLPVLLALIAAIALAALVVAALPAQAATQDADGARVIVKFKALGPLMRSARERGDRGPQQAATLAGRHGMSLRDGRMIDARSQVVWGDKTLTSTALAARLALDADVEYAVPDGRRRALAGRTLTGYQWSLTSGSAIAALNGSTTGPTAPVTTSATSSSGSGGGGAMSWPSPRR